MRRLLVATILGAALSTPAFAADADDVPTPALTISPATIAAAANNGAPAANTDLATRSSFNYRRPSVLPALYATSAALQGYDAASTLRALQNGAHEANPMMKGVVKSPAAFVAMAYQDAWEWPVAIAYASALIAGGWRTILMPPREEHGAVPRQIPGPEPARA